ncbi:MAG: TraR/DksA C4-type zinc finger protein [bacterium]
MDQNTINILKEKLLEEKKNLEQELKTESTTTPLEADGLTAKFPDYGDKEEENASEVADYSTTVTLEKQIEKSLLAVNEALEKIENGEYGNCQTCNEEIEQNRLLANPTAKQCLKHASQ